MALGHLTPFDPKKHPRGIRGRFSEILGKIKPGEGVKLPDGHTVTKQEGGTFHVSGPNAKGAVFKDAKEAADHALHQSALHTDEKSLGGSKSMTLGAAAKKLRAGARRSERSTKSTVPAGEQERRNQATAGLDEVAPRGSKRMTDKARAQQGKPSIEDLRKNYHVNKEIALKQVNRDSRSGVITGPQRTLLVRRIKSEEATGSRKRREAIDKQEAPSTKGDATKRSDQKQRRQEKIDRLVAEGKTHGPLHPVGTKVTTEEGLTGVVDKHSERQGRVYNHVKFDPKSKNPANVHESSSALVHGDQLTPTAKPPKRSRSNRDNTAPARKKSSRKTPTKPAHPGSTQFGNFDHLGHGATDQFGGTPAKNARQTYDHHLGWLKALEDGHQYNGTIGSEDAVVRQGDRYHVVNPTVLLNAVHRDGLTPEEAVRRASIADAGSAEEAAHILANREHGGGSPAAERDPVEIDKKVQQAVDAEKDLNKKNALYRELKNWRKAGGEPGPRMKRVLDSSPAAPARERAAKKTKPVDSTVKKASQLRVGDTIHMPEHETDPETAFSRPTGRTITQEVTGVRHTDNATHVVARNADGRNEHTFDHHEDVAVSPTAAPKTDAAPSGPSIKATVNGREVDVRAGDKVSYDTVLGPRHIVVDEVSNNIKNGRPGFGGTIAGGGPDDTVWGYAEQIRSHAPASSPASGSGSTANVTSEHEAELRRAIKNAPDEGTRATAEGELQHLRAGNPVIPSGVLANSERFRSGSAANVAKAGKSTENKSKTQPKSKEKPIKLPMAAEAKLSSQPMGVKVKLSDGTRIERKTNEFGQVPMRNVTPGMTHGVSVYEITHPSGRKERVKGLGKVKTALESRGG